VPEGPYLPIGEFSRKVGVDSDLLRAWERRYGVPKPSRTANGRRLYSAADERAVNAMRDAKRDGLPAAEAARRATAVASRPLAWRAPDGDLPTIRARLGQALSRYDEAGGQDELDRLFGAYSIEAGLSQVVLPYLREIGARWARNEITVADEHFATNIVAGRLLSLARKWDAGGGPRAVLACPPGELHTIGLLSFGLSLRAHGWRITYLGADTPLRALAQIAETVQPRRVVLASVAPHIYTNARDGLAELAAATPIAIAGSGASDAIAADIGAHRLESDPVTAAGEISRLVHTA
jgi:DNA-binding transcriptional MerR regulator/methanogenic corrinoid protein MtbC1